MHRLQKLRFYIIYSITNLRVNGRQTVFGLLCIAAGVAAVVAMQTIGQMIRDTFTVNLQESNMADIRVLPQPRPSTPPQLVEQARAEGLVSPQESFRLTAVRRVQAWIDENYPGEIILTYRHSVEGNSGLLVTNLRTGILNPLTIPYIVDPERYPLYGEIYSEDGTPLDLLIQHPTDIVISRNLADTLQAQVGDTLRLNNASVDFTLRGIVPSNVQGALEPFSIAAGVVGFYYLDLSATQYFDQMVNRADAMFLRLAEPERTEEINRALLEAFPYFSTQTTQDLREQNSAISNTITQLVSIMGLVSILIGGIGIINTMLVVVRRRMREVAVLKTLGLEPEQVTALFLVEAALIGIGGSAVGVLLGWLVAYLTSGLAAAFLAQPLDYRIAPGPTLSGFVVGVVVTGVFGFLPTLIASEIRPSLVLNPREEVMPRAGRLRVVAVLSVMLLVLALVARGLVGATPEVGALDLNLLAGVAGLVVGLLAGASLTVRAWQARRQRGASSRRAALVAFYLLGLPLIGFGFAYAVPTTLLLAIVFALVGVLYVLLWGLIWLMGQLAPSWLQLDLKLAIRSLFAARSRNASTLLALVVGVLTLSLLTLLVNAVRQRFVEQLVQETGGNVIIYTTGAASALQAVEDTLTNAYGPDSYAVVRHYRLRLTAVYDHETGQALTPQELNERVAAQFDNEARAVDQLRSTLQEIDARGVTANLPDFPFYAGRQLDAADAGEHVIVVAANNATLAAGISVGDRLTYAVGEDDSITFEIVGMTDRRNSIISGLSALNYVPLDLIPPTERPTDVRVIMSVNPSQITGLRRALSNVRGVFVLETESLNDLLNRVIDQFSSFPILVAGLALFTGSIVIANSVALSMMERQRDIATMKALGLARWRVLIMLLVEYGLMGLVGGVIGVGIGVALLGVILAFFFQGEVGGSAAPYASAVLLMLLCVGIALGAALVSAWGASGEKPLNVLRYK